MKLTSRFRAFSFTLLLITVLVMAVSQTATAQGTSKFGKEIAKYETIQGTPGNIEKWVVWDKPTCSWKDVTKDAADLNKKWGRPADTYTAILRDGTNSGVKIAWTPEDQVFDTLVVANKSFADAAESSHNEVKLFDNAYPSTEAPITAAEQVVQYKADVVISMLVLADLHPAILAKYKEACIPVIGHSVPHEGNPFFGGSFLDAGKLGADYLGKKATEKGWKPETTSVLLCTDSRWLKNPGTPYDAVLGFRDALKTSFPGVPEKNIAELDCPSTIVDDEARVIDWLTANPTTNNLIMFGSNDLRALGMYNAVKTKGISDRAILSGVGVSKESQEPICNNDSVFLMSADFVPQLWGQYGIAMAQDVVDGIPIPWRVLPKIQPVDNSNIRKLGMKLCKDQK